MGDDIVECFPTFIAAALSSAILSSGLTGVELDEVL
jgi:hypothetical protein